MNILVTGGFGFIGRHLTSTFEANHIEVTPFGNREAGQLVQNRGDSFLSQFDVIYHLAAIPRVGVSLEKPGLVLHNNHESTLRLLEYCRHNPKTKLIFASSSSVKFANLQENPYALSKKMGEDLIKLYVDTYGITASSVRFFNVYGPGESEYGKNTTLVKAFKKCILEKRNFKVNGDGSIRRDYTHVNDVVSGLARVHMEMIRGNHKPLYEIGSGQDTSVKQIAEAFQEGTDLEIEYGPARNGDAPFTCADQNLLPVGWYPTVDVIEYIREWKASGCPND